MAIVKGDLVLIPLISTGTPVGTYGPVLTPQEPLVGIVDDAASDIAVLWNGSGSLVTAIDPASLDVMDPPDAAELARLQGTLVQITPGSGVGWSPEYQGIVMSMYKRDPAGADTPSATYALVRTAAGAYFEILSAQLSPVAGR